MVSRRFVHPRRRVRADGVSDVVTSLADLRALLATLLDRNHATSWSWDERYRLAASYIVDMARQYPAEVTGEWVLLALAEPDAARLILHFISIRPHCEDVLERLSAMAS